MNDFDPFPPYIEAVQEAYRLERRIKISVFGAKPVIGSIKSVSRDFFVLENEYSEWIVRYEQIRWISVFRDEEEPE